MTDLARQLRPHGGGVRAGAAGLRGGGARRRRPAAGRGRARPRRRHRQADAAARAAIRARARGRAAGGMRAVLERVVPEAEALGGHRGRDPARGRRRRCRLRRRGVPLVRDCGDARGDRTRAPAGRDAGDPLQPGRRRLRAAAAGGVLGRLPRGRDREAAGADGPHRTLESVLPGPVRAARRVAASRTRSSSTGRRSSRRRRRGA